MDDQNEPQAKKQLWQINEVMLNDNYLIQTAADGSVHYVLAADRVDLPATFWRREWEDATERREEAERLASSSGKWAQDARQAGGTNAPNYQLPSQQIAKDPNLGMLTSSAERAKDARKKKKKGKDKA